MAISTLLGFLIMAMLWPASLPRVWIWAFAPALGCGACSIIASVFRRPMFTVEFALLLVLSGIVAFRSRAMPIKMPALRQWRVPAMGLILAGALGMSLPGLILRTERAPHGYWDGFAIWNMHARFIYRDGANWKNGIQRTFLPDYPLLTPMLTARLWRYAGQDAPEAGAMLGIAFVLSGIAVLTLTLSQLREKSLAALIAVILLGTPNYLEHGTSQYADVPLSVFILCTIALICFYFQHEGGRRGLLVLAGFTAGCAGWTKNEGLLFIAATCGVLLLPSLRKPAATFRRFAPFSAGLLIPLAAIVFFKLTVAPPNYMLQGRQSQELIRQMLDSGRHIAILRSFVSTAWTFGLWTVQPLIPLLAFIGLRKIDRETLQSFGWLTGIGIILLVLAGYYVVFLATPIPLQYHLESTLDRLLLHLWPSFLLLISLPSMGNRFAQEST